MKQYDVIIVGAGAAGLAAARILSQAGKSVLILEGRDRIGGRIWTIRDKSFGVPVEMGAEFIHGRPKVTWDLVHRAGLATVDLPFESHEHRGKRLVHLPDFDGEVDEVMKGLKHVKRDVSFAEYLRHHAKGRRLAQARKLAIGFVEGFDAADIERISAKSLAEEQEGLADFEDQMQFRLVEGYGSLIDYLCTSLDRQRVKTKLKTVVSEIRWDRGKVQVRCGRNGGESFHGQHVIVTLPVGMLQLAPDVAGAVRFVPDLPQKRKAAAQLGSGHIVKAILSFRKPFWEQEAVARMAGADKSLRDAVFMHDLDSAFPTVWTARPVRAAVLTAWAGGPKAVALAGMSKSELRETALNALTGLFAMRRRKLDGLLEGFHSYDWANDPLARGAYSYVEVGGVRARAELARHVEGTVFFAGEATDTKGQASTVAGALASGQRAGREILRIL